MGETRIEWCRYTFNPWWGCIRVSPGCEHCYAETLAKRYGHAVWGPSKTTGRRTFGEKHWNEPRRWNAKAEKDGVRERVFCASMADVFEDHPALDAERAKLWPLIEQTPALDWLLLTKRPENAVRMMPRHWSPAPRNVWFGTSAEDQRRWDERVPHLIRIPGFLAFVSAEPLLGPIECSDLECVDWVIVGGESGPGARPNDIAWARSIVTQCRAAGTAPFVKQLGRYPIMSDPEPGWLPLYSDPHGQHPNGQHARRLRDAKGGDPSEWPEDLRVREWPTSPVELLSDRGGAA